MKICTICNEQFPEDQFYRSATTGYLSPYCKPCHRNISLENYMKNPPTAEQKAEWARRRRLRCQTPEYKARRKEEERRRVERDKLKIYARNLIQGRVRRGKLKRLPCEQCGDRHTEAHHEDYSKPLDVLWLCRTHHLAIHNAQRRRDLENRTGMVMQKAI